MSPVNLKNSLAFNLAPGASVTLLHLLASPPPRPRTPDIIHLPNADLSVVATDTSITLTNNGAVQLSGYVLVEYWHTIERDFPGNAANLPGKPYIVYNASPQDTAPFSPVEITLYARLTGNDTTGKGTQLNPYRTFQRAIRDVPNIIPGGTIFTVDITDLGVENLPEDYEFPAILAPSTFYNPVDFGGTYVPVPFYSGAAFNIRAFPKPASNIPLADTSVPAAQVIGTSVDPVSKLITIEVQRAGAPIASWAADALEGKFLVLEGSGWLTAVIHGSANIGPSSFIYVAQDVDFYAGSNLSIVECSATLNGNTSFTKYGSGQGITALNTPQMAFQGIAFTSDTTFRVLNTAGGTVPVFSLCDIQGINNDGATVYALVYATVIRNVLTSAGSALEAVSCLFKEAGISCFAGQGTGFFASAFKGCGVIGAGPLFTNGPSYPVPGWEFLDCLISGSYGSASVGAIRSNGGGMFSLLNVKIENCIADAIVMQGSAYAVLENVGGSGNGGYGIHVDDGGKVRVLDDATNVTGTLGDMKSGTQAVRAWGTAVGVPAGNFRFDAPVKNELDLVSPPVGDETTGAGTGGTSLSRIFQRPV